MILGHHGHNEGVGRAINRSFAIATGDYLIKSDQDAVFTPRWLDKAIRVLDADDFVGMVGLFKYGHPPVDWREMQRDQGRFSGQAGVPEYHYVEDFVSSAFVIPTELYRELGPLPEHSAAFAEDVEYKHKIQDAGLELALLDEDVVTNTGFGIGPSTICLPGGKVHEINYGPKIF